MSDNCQLVVFSNKAYNAIIRESFDKDPVETGGILLGHILDNGVWIVMEVLPPGINSIFQYAYFEYDEAFVNYLAQSVANQYKRPLDLLGLWHRHPGSMDVFSTTDDGTNTTFARQNPAGVISGLVNIDPNFRITMYHLDRPMGRFMGRPNYSVVDVEVGDDIIPEEYFELRYFGGAGSDLHPTVAQRQRNAQPRHVISNPDVNGTVVEVVEENVDNPNGLDIKNIISGNLPPCSNDNNATPNAVNDFFAFWRDSKKRWWYVLLAVVALILTVSSFRSCKSGISDLLHRDKTENTDANAETQKPSLSVASIELKLGDEPEPITIENITKGTKVKWVSKDKKVATVDKGIVTPVGVGKTTVYAYIENECIGKCRVVVNEVTKETEPNAEDVNNESTEVATMFVKLNRTEGNVDKGKSFDLPINIAGNPTITYASSDPSVASVSENGVVQGLKQGKATISVCWNDEEPLLFTLTVK
ncbi:MAG: Ig-like domain-containing protein [Muribaculum sp.]|nr:Ig-like domain-containing protein [Muribaculum sp.]